MAVQNLHVGRHSGGHRKKKKLMTTLGLEPRISRSVVGCLIQLGQAADVRAQGRCAHINYQMLFLVSVSQSDALTHAARRCVPHVQPFTQLLLIKAEQLKLDAEELRLRRSV